MSRYLSLSIFALMMLSGVAAGTFLRFQPPAREAVWLLPAALFAAGAVGLHCLAGWRYALTAMCLSVLAVVGISFLVWPSASLLQYAQQPSSQQHLSAGGALHQVDLLVAERFRNGDFAESRSLLVPHGARIAVFAAGLDAPRFMALTPNGDILVSEPRSGRIRLLRDGDRDGVAERIATYAEGLQRPHGLAFYGSNLYVAETGRISLLRDSDGDGLADSRSTVSSDVPGRGGHWTRSIAVGSDGALYVSAGSSCDVCVEDDPRRGAILRFSPGTERGEIYAVGLRNSVGLAIHPRTGELWASDNGRDMLGDELPPEEINRIEKGGDYGWPYCYGERVPDPDYGSDERCAGTVAPQVQMQAHSAPLGIAFGNGLNFPPAYRDMLYVAFHGSWNRSVPTGYKLVAIPFDGGRPNGPPVDIASGWLQRNTAWGRPVAPLVGADGALYISDDRAGAVYRLWFPSGDQPQDYKPVEPRKS